ncbi:Alpha/Beta hydrolase protein [Syncephalis plumigaleata]|nr:Alpha/Beta hydrolase protein [Syncephalis plumigaleata]
MTEPCHITQALLHFCGLELDVYGPNDILNVLGIAAQPEDISNISESATSNKPIDVLIFIHGREQSKRVISKKCRALAIAGNSSRTATGNLLVITFDLPNHGGRLKDASRNLSWAQGNIDHGLDMWGCIYLALNEIKTIISLLPTTLGQPVRRWAVGGISLGGHITSMALAEDPRIQMGIVAIGCGNLHQRYTDMLKDLHVPEWKMRDVLNQMAQYDATYHIDRVIHARNDAQGPLSNRWIMVLHGEDDDIVSCASNQPFIQALKDRMNISPDEVHETLVNSGNSNNNNGTQDGGASSKHGCLRVNIYPNVKHVVNTDMQEAMCRWIEEWMQVSPEESSFTLNGNEQRTYKL